LLDAVVLMEEAGRQLASGPLAETLAAARILGQLGGENATALLARALSGEAVVAIAPRDAAAAPKQWIAGGAVAKAVVARNGDDVVIVSIPESARGGEANLASTPIAEIDLGAYPQSVIGAGPAALEIFAAGLEEWKLLIAAALAGLSREALRLAAEYACERVAFGQPIGAYQAISHPMADLLCDVEGGKLLTWKAVRDIADGSTNAGATLSLAAWWNADAAARAVAHALHTFGGYGLTTEYDIHLYNLRAKAWPLIFGDPEEWLAEAGRRIYGGEKVALPDAGEVSIDFDIGDEARALAAEIDAFFEKNMTDEIRAKAHYSWEGHNPDFHKKLAAAGLLYLAWPKEIGGRGAPVYALNAALEAFEHHGWNNPAISVTEMVGSVIYRFGGEELKRDLLPKIIAGEAICCLGYSEPGSGSDVFAAQCRATRDGNGWRIDGTKMFTSGANVTDYVLMLTRTNTEVPKHKGLTMFIVPLKTEGVTIQPVYTFQDERTNITFYDGVRIPDSCRLGDVDGGVKTMSAGLELEHGGNFARMSRQLLLAAEALCRDIKQNGRALIEQPRAQMRLARTAANIMVADLLSFRLQWALHEKKPSFAYGPMTKLFSSEKFLSDSRDLLDLTAPHSLSKRDGPAGHINQCYRHAQGTTIYAGTSEVHRSLIAERGLGLPRTRA
jgi:alkylation response protein AidB-like acyl-CoA dehydrogenase